VGQGAAEIGSAANSYEILAKLASGGMAEIFLAKSASIGGVERYVVLKRIMRHRAADTQLVRMFLDEARLAAQLQHANIAQVYDIGKLGDAYFFTMEYVHGETVRALLHRSHALRKPVPLGCVLTIAAGTAAGLDYAHGRIGHDGRPLNIVHRDVSPSNLMVSFDGGVKIVDFGVAKAADRIHDTRSGTVKGKIAYLSPEQCKGTPVDRRSDLFSFGIVMWEMLTTERLYRRGSDFDNMTAIVNEATVAPSTKRSEVPPELDAIVLRLLAKDPDQRFQTAGEALEAIEQVAAQSGSVLSTAGLGRQMRELFGQRPEPWIELESLEVHEGVTVTGEPVVGESVGSAASLELQLATVQPLGGAVPTLEASAKIEAPSASLGVPAQPITIVADSGSHSMNVAPIDYPRVDRRTALRAAEESSSDVRPRRPRRVVIATSAAVVLGIAIGIWAATRPSTDVQTAAIASPDVGTIAMPTVIVDAGSVVTTPVDAASIAAVAPSDAGVAPIDAAPVATVAPAVVHPPKQTTKPDLSHLFLTAKYKELVDACRTTASADRALCTMAACHVHDVELARKWARSVPASNHSLVTGCRKLGVELDPTATPPPTPTPTPTQTPPPPKPDCDTNPLACQHP